MYEVAVEKRSRVPLRLVSLLLLVGCASAPSTREPRNLYPLKQEIRAYVGRGDYQRDIAAVVARAQAWIAERAARGGTRLAVVFDLDETLISNWPEMSAMDFGYVPAEWQRWVDRAEAPAIEPVRAVFRAALERGVAVMVITGRPERDRAATERNLRAIGCGDYSSLICLPATHRGSSAAFKTAMRRMMTEEGLTIIANLGDQESDLAGGFAEKTFKVPNPFYVTE